MFLCTCFLREEGSVFVRGVTVFASAIKVDSPYKLLQEVVHSKKKKMSVKLNIKNDKTRLTID